MIAGDNSTEKARWDCQTCGACCAAFRVSFYWAETDAHPAGHVPQAMTASISPYHVAMLGTQLKPVRCIALCGDVGQSVSCSIYDKRSSTCREFELGSEDCIKARKINGLTT
jgi:Fe-S-cluster containining protein